MSDASDVQHHLEEGLLLFTRGMVFEARDAWRKVLQIDPSNGVALDYIRSTESELNPYDRQREAEAARQSRSTPRPRSGGWEDDELEVIAAGPADDDDDSVSRRDASVTGFMIADDESDGAASRPARTNGATAAGTWSAIPEDEDGGSDWEDEAAAPVTADDEETPARGPRAPAGGMNGGGARPDGAEEWEPLSWMDEDTPAAPVAAQGWAQNAIRDQGRTSGAAQISGRQRASREPASEERASTDQREWTEASYNGQQIAVAVEEPTAQDLQQGIRANSPAALYDELFTGERPGDGAEAPVEEPVVEVVPTETLLDRAHDAMQQGRPDTARSLLQKVLEREPGLTLAQRQLERAEAELIRRYEHTLGAPEGVPMLTRSLSELTNLDLDQVGGYILSRIDGILTLDDIYTLSAHIDRLTVMKILAELIEARIITIRR